MEKTYVYSDDEERLSTKERNDEAIMMLDGLKFWLKTMKQYVDSENNPSPEIAVESVDRLLLGEPYLLSYNKQVLLFIAQPRFSMVDTDKGIVTIHAIRDIIADAQKKYPDVYAGITGGIALMVDEFEAVMGGMWWTSIIGFVLILAVFIVVFRMWISPVLAGAVLIIGVIWTAAFAALTVGSLNIMTSMFFIILFGLGIDFSIHVISGFTEHRRLGFDIRESTFKTLNIMGPGVSTGAITTAVAFLTLCISENRGMKEFGIVVGSGVIFSMLATFFILPSLLVLREKRYAKKKTAHDRAYSYEFKFLGNFSEKYSRGRIIAVILPILLTVFLGFQAKNIKFDYNMLNIEPKGTPSVDLNDTLVVQFDMSPDYALVTGSDLDSIRIMVEEAKKFGNISMVESITDYIPSRDDQNKRAEIIRSLRNDINRNRRTVPINNSTFNSVIEQLGRLWMNVTELSSLAFQQGQDRLEHKCYELVENPSESGSTDYIRELIAYFRENRSQAIRGLNNFKNDYFPYMREIALSMANPEFLSLDNIPQKIRDRYISKDSSHFLVSIYPKKAVWNLENLNAFTKNIWFALLGMVPLVSGALWMTGIASGFGLLLNVVNVMALPLIIGIGIDDGVHIIHRFRIEGSENIGKIFTSTGKAIFLTSITTMIAFGSLIFNAYRGLASMGLFLFIGIACCFITTILILAPVFRMIKHT